MSLLTRCPRCANVYQVVDDQLQISNGWVRCGQCGEIFEAAAQLVEPVTVVKDSQSSETPVLEEPADQNRRASVDGPADPIPEPVLPTERQRLTGPGATTEPMLIKESAAEPTPEPALSPDGVLQASDQPAFLSAPACTAREVRAGVVSMAWALICLLLAMALAGQWLYRERDRLATIRPELKPILQMLCRPLKCQVAAMRRTDALVIDASAFTTAGKDSYRLTFVVKNQSTLPVAVPNIELSLTDSLDHVIVRRVLTPGEMGSAEEPLAAGAQWPVSVALQLALEPGRVFGYRLLVFYP